jgi:putative ABC transport system permease protein
MMTFLADLRYGARMLARSPGFTAVAVLSLALGIGANTTIFSVVHSLLLRPLPVSEPERLVKIYTVLESDSRMMSSSYPDYEDLRDISESFTGLAVCRYMPLGLSGFGKAEVLLGEIVSHNYFDVVGVQPVLGRGFLPEEGDSEGSHPVVILSHAIWNARFGGDRQVLGSDISINRQPFRVVGVAPEGFQAMHVGIRPDMWIPIQMQAAVSPIPTPLDARSMRYLRIVGRLKAGTSVEQANAEVVPIVERLSEQYPDDNSGNTATVISADRDRLIAGVVSPDSVRLFMSVLLALVGLVLLIACFNVANLMLARALGRQREIAVRLSLGASRLRVVRQLLTESVLLALLAGGVGLLCSLWATRLLEMVRPPLPIAIEFDLAPDATVLAFTLGISVLAGILFGLMPALRAFRPRLFGALRDRRSSGVTSPGGVKLERGLVIAQVALSMFLIVAAGLCVQSLRNVQAVDLGFDPSKILTLNVNPTMARYDEETGLRLQEQLLDRVREIPGVRAASMAAMLPLGADTLSTGFTVAGYELKPDERPTVFMNLVSEGYFETMNIPLISGRSFTAQDRKGNTAVMVVNQAAAERYWPRGEVVGGMVRVGQVEWQVVGVTASTRHVSLHDENEPLMYLPMAQFSFGFANYQIRTEGEPRNALAPVLRELERLDPNLPVSDVKTMEDHLGFVLLPSRMLSLLTGGFGLIAFLISMIGVYGVISYTVGQRTQEFGLRAALGATRTNILVSVVRDGIWIAVGGLVAGIGLSVALTRWLGSLLHGVNPTDPLVFVVVCASVTLAVITASLVPANRASRVSPSSALRYE